MRGVRAFGALSQPNGAQLRERADRRPEAPLHCLDTRDEGGCHRAHAGNQNAQTAIGGRNGDVTLFWQCETSPEGGLRAQALWRGAPGS